MNVVPILLILGAVCSLALSACVSCKYSTATSDCKDVFTPKGSEADICNTVNQDLCKKYGDYNIYCTSPGSSRSCRKKGQCSGAAPSMYMTSIAFSIVFSLFIKSCF